MLYNHRTENMNRKECNQSLGMNIVSPSQHERVYNSRKCSQIIILLNIKNVKIVVCKVNTFRIVNLFLLQTLICILQSISCFKLIFLFWMNRLFYFNCEHYLFVYIVKQKVIRVSILTINIFLKIWMIFVNQCRTHYTGCPKKQNH